MAAQGRRHQLNLNFLLLKLGAVWLLFFAGNVNLSAHWVSNSMINTTNWQLAPEAEFYAELARFGLISSTETKNQTEGKDTESSTAETEELKEALGSKEN